MCARAQAIGPTPPLALAWRGSVGLVSAVVGENGLYGITADGRLAAYAKTDGAPQWVTEPTYLTSRLSLDGSTLYAFRSESGLMAIQDQGGAFKETLLYAIPAAGPTVSQPVPVGTSVHFVLDQQLISVNKSGGQLFVADLSDEGPYSLFPLGTDLLVVSGDGHPSRWHVESTGYSRVWASGLSSSDQRIERTAVVSGDRIVVAESGGVSCYNASNGSPLWTRGSTGNLALAVNGSTLYTAGDQAALWAIDLATGSRLWDRQYLVFVSHTSRVGLAVAQQHLWVGALLDDGNEPAALWAVDLADGSFAWQATGVSLVYGNGLPLAADDRIYTYGSTDPVTAMSALSSSPTVNLGSITQSPNPLRGAWGTFNPVEAHVKLTVPASISFIAWHERDVRNNGIGPINYQPGDHTIYWDARWPRGWTDVPQFGRLAFDIHETATGLNYTQVLLIPVNTLSDIQHHWAKPQIEIMLYHKYIGGYPDLTFKPDNQITRGETSTIIARTMALEKPSSGFHTKFTDIATHWAKNYIMALEELGIIGGFLEPDGTYTFRPDINITRSQEAKILVSAYNVPPAPASFISKFTDIAGHWAEAPIKALEAKGYVSGFREADGTYTYRPEQNLTRAELSVMVVRIQNLKK